MKNLFVLLFLCGNLYAQDTATVRIPYGPYVFCDYSVRGQKEVFEHYTLCRHNKVIITTYIYSKSGLIVVKSLAYYPKLPYIFSDFVAHEYQAEQFISMNPKRKDRLNFKAIWDTVKNRNR